MRILLLPFGSAGDVLPFVWLARHLKARGHEVTLITASLFRTVVERAGLAFVPIGQDEDFERLMRDPRIWRLGSGTKAVFGYAAEAAGRFLEAIAAVRAQQGAADLMLAPVTAFGARLAREVWGTRLVTVHLQPAVLLSAHEMPVLVPALAPWVAAAPVWFKRLMLQRGPNPVDWFAGPKLRKLCQEHGVRPPKSFFREWWDSPDGSVVLFPEWFAAPQPDWPEGCFQAGFPLEDLSREQGLVPDLEAFLERHAAAPPVVFTAGSANVQAADFLAVAVAALERLGRPGVLVTRDLAQVPERLPEMIRAVEYTPFGPLLRRAGAFVHHGGIGTLSQGFAAGVPQLLMPMAHDQPDNAVRLKRLGAGDWLSRGRFTPERVAERLEALLTSEPVAAACARLRERTISGKEQWLEGLLSWLERGAVAKG
jgi:rhamnosyltransferase subunit B